MIGRGKCDEKERFRIDIVVHFNSAYLHDN